MPTDYADVMRWLFQQAGVEVTCETIARRAPSIPGYPDVGNKHPS